MNKISIGLVGAGTIGGGVIKLLARQSDFFAKTLGMPLVLARVADLTPARCAALPIGNAVCSASADDILNDPEIQIVIELVGGTTFAKSLVLKAIAKKKHVITANKALLAEHGPEIFAAATHAGVSVFFEAAVGGGMPIIKTIREAMIGNDVLSVKTIINGTCNYILTRMSAEGASFADVVADAQKNGYAEADPALDIGGGDSGHKVAIMASLLHGGYVSYDHISIEGITAITQQDIEFAKNLGYTIKLLGVINRNGKDPLDVRVHPALLPNKHILASVSNVFNAVLLEGDAVGQILLYGRGAGEFPTASAVLSDIIDVARNIIGANPHRIPMDYYSANNEIPLLSGDEVISRFYFRFMVADKPAVLASIARVFGDHGISIASVLQQEGYSPDCVPVVFLSHASSKKKVSAALADIEKMDFVKQSTTVIRIEE